MAIERVREYFKQWGLENRIMEFDVSSATVELAAQALSCRPERIAKTLSFRLGEQRILIVAAGDAKIDNAKYKEMCIRDSLLPVLQREQTADNPFGFQVAVGDVLDNKGERCV